MKKKVMTKFKNFQNNEIIKNIIIEYHMKTLLNENVEKLIWFQKNTIKYHKDELPMQPPTVGNIGLTKRLMQ